MKLFSISCLQYSEHFLVRVGDHFPGLVERIMLLVCLDDGRLSGGVPLSQKYPISYRRKARSALTQAANFHMAKVL